MTKDKIQDTKQRAHHVKLPREHVYQDRMMVQVWRSAWAIIYVAYKPHTEQAGGHYYVWSIDRSSNAPAETLGLLLSVAETLDAAIAIAAAVNGTTS